jgi:hypothetical protein
MMRKKRMPALRRRKKKKKRKKKRRKRKRNNVYNILNIDSRKETHNNGTKTSTQAIETIG